MHTHTKKYISILFLLHNTNNFVLFTVFTAVARCEHDSLQEETTGSDLAGVLHRRDHRLAEPRGAFRDPNAGDRRPTWCENDKQRMFKLVRLQTFRNFHIPCFYIGINVRQGFGEFDTVNVIHCLK